MQLKLVPLALVQSESKISTILKACIFKSLKIVFMWSLPLKTKEDPLYNIKKPKGIAQFHCWFSFNNSI